MRELLQRCLLAHLGLLLGIFGVEATVRVGGMDPLVERPELVRTENQRPDCIRPAAQVGYELVPGHCGANDLGFRSPNRAVEKAEGTTRILAMGDSITEQRAWVDILERVLTESGHPRLEVWNLGVTGYSVLNELEQLRWRALDLDPDMVILQVCLNDYGHTPVLFSHEGELHWLQADTGAMGLGALWLLEHSALYRYLLLRSVERAHWGTGDPAYLDRVDAALAEMKALCEARGIPFHVVLFPTLRPSAQWSSNETIAYQRFTSAGTRGVVPLLDLTPRMLSGDVEDLRRYRGKLTFEQLDDQIAAWQLDPSLAQLIRKMDLNMLGVDKPVNPHMKEDYTHPNFMGHAIAASMLADHIEAELPR